MWRTYFPKALIYGIDIYDKSGHDERRIKTFKGSQADSEFLEHLMSQTGPFDIIIDDGSHMNEHILYTFKYLFPRLTDNGLYVIEDLQTSYWRKFGGSNELNRPDTAMGFLKCLVDGLNHAEFELPSYQPSYFDRHIVALHFYHNIAFIQKGCNDELGGDASLGRTLHFNSAVAPPHGDLPPENYTIGEEVRLCF